MRRRSARLLQLSNPPISASIITDGSLIEKRSTLNRKRKITSVSKRSLTSHPKAICLRNEEHALVPYNPRVLPSPTPPPLRVSVVDELISKLSATLYDGQMCNYKNVTSILGELQYYRSHSHLVQDQLLQLETRLE